MEDGTPQELIDELSARGHTINSDGIFGNANMILIEPDSGAVYYGADPRGGVNKGLNISQ